ncbi:MAG TPA: hypothetical protein VFN03_09675, partial [Trueperaceae bacterium]|nr:hypothetical protein [Trueperaceae bacterium]
VRCDVVPHITAAEIARTIATADQCGGTGATVFGLTQVGMFADESTFRSALETAASSGIRQFKFYEYGLLSERHLTWLRNAKYLWSGSGPVG